MRWVGAICFINARLCSSGLLMVSGVAMMPGATALTITLCGASSSASPRVAWFSPPLTIIGSRAGTLLMGCMAMAAVMVTMWPAPLGTM
ncbi:hypothetical protein D3C80_1487560 [compost metagenome]